MQEFRALLNRIDREERELAVTCEYDDLSESLRSDIQRVIIPSIIHQGLTEVKEHLKFAA